LRGGEHRDPLWQWFDHPILLHSSFRVERGFAQVNLLGADGHFDDKFGCGGMLTV